MKLTGKLALDLEQLPLALVLGGKGGVDVEELLDHVKEVVPAHVRHDLAAVQRQELALDAEDGLAADVFDVEAVEELLLDHERVSVGGDELVKDADRLREGRELGCHFLFIVIIIIIIIVVEMMIKKC